MNKTALVLIDLQNEWANPESPYFIGNLDPMIDDVNELIRFARKEKMKIIFTRHLEPENAEAFSLGSANAELIAELERDDADTVIEKYKISPFYETNLERELKAYDRVMVAGLLTNLCVRSFVEGAYDRDKEIIVVKDLCATYDEEIQAFTIEDLKETREEVQFKNLKDIIDKKNED